ncbi:MAG: MgtC/SapB family protein [Thermoanaerobaculia bacterium]|nr:MgtC/SapB family protein [Thermoanaerobaculia bacterium]
MESAFLDIDLKTMLSYLFRMGLAFGLALPVAWDREQEGRTLGLRTFPLVAMASAGYILVAQSVLGFGSEGQSRIIQGLMTGIGFLGGGAIVKQGMSVKGAATAATIWSTAAVGAAVAYARYEIALVLTLVNFAVLRTMDPLKDAVNDDSDASDG